MYFAAAIAGLLFSAIDLSAGSSWPALLFYYPMAFFYSKTSERKMLPITDLGLLGVCCEGTRQLLKTGYGYLTSQKIDHITVVSPLHALLLAGLSVTAIAFYAVVSKRTHKLKEEDPPTKTAATLNQIVYDAPPPSPPSTSPLTCPSSISAFF